MAYALCITSNAWSVRLDTWRSHSAAHAASGGGADRTTEPLAAEAALGGGGGAHKGCADSGVHGLPSVDTSIPSRRYHTPFGRQPGASTGWLTRATTAPQSSHTCPATDRLPSATFSCRFFSPPLPFRRAWPPTAPCAGACRSVALPPQTAEPVVAAPSRVGQAPMGRNPPSWAGAHGAAGPAGGQP